MVITDATQKTKEMIEYENALKAYRIASIKIRVINEGVDVSKLSNQKLDMVMRILDDMEIVNRDSRMKSSTIQQEANNKMAEIQKETNKRFADLQKKYQDIIAQFKTEDGLKIETGTKEETKEEIKEDSESEKTMYEKAGVSQEKLDETEKIFSEQIT